MNKKIIILIFLFQFVLFSQNLFSQTPTPTSVLTPEQIALHPTDKWFTAERPDYSELDERVKNLAKNEESPEAVARIICEGLKTDIEKARAIFDWLAFNVSYDTNYSVYSGKEAFKKRKGVCQGYAELFQMLAKAAGLDSVMVTGIGYGGPGIGRGEHAWNLVHLPDRDLLLDACWGAGTVSGRRFTFNFAPQWFDTHPAAFAFRHYPDNPKNACIYPLMSKKEFNRLPWLQPESYFPYGKSDPVYNYNRLFCKDQPNLPVTFSSHRNGNLFFQYISTGAELTDGFFMMDYEAYINDVKKYLSEEELKTTLLNNYDSDTVSSISDLPLALIAKYCNAKSEAYEMEKCYSISINEETGVSEITCDFSKCGFRLPTKEEWLTACGKKYLSYDISEKEFSDAVWYNKNTGGIIKVVNQTLPNENGLYDMFGNVSELCYDKDEDCYVFLGGNVFSSRREIQNLTSVLYDEYKENKGAHGFRLVFNAPTQAKYQYKVSQFYANSEQYSKKSSQYKEWLNLAIKNGSPDAMACLASDYYGLDTDDGYRKAYDLCIKAAEMENAYALYILGMLYQYGSYVQKNENEAFKYYERGAIAGNASAAYKTAIYYKNGKFTEQNNNKYFYWLEKSIKDGYNKESAIIELASAYRDGRGCEKNQKKAFELIDKEYSKKNASVRILEEYGDYIKEQIGNHFGIVYAEEAYKKAAQQGSGYAKEQLAELAIYGKDGKRDLGKAVTLYQELIDSGYKSKLIEEKIYLYSTLLEFMNDFEDKCDLYVNMIGRGKDPTPYINSIYGVYIECLALQKTELKYSALFASLDTEIINSKMKAPMKKINSGEKISGKTLIFISPFAYHDNKSYNQKLFDEYDNVLVVQRSQNSFEELEKAFAKILPFLDDGSTVDLCYFQSDIRKNNSNDKERYLRYSSEIKNICQKSSVIVF